MIRFGRGCTALLALLAAACTSDSPNGGVVALDQSAAGADFSRSSSETEGGRFIALRDDCDPGDPAFNSIGGCLQNKGSVTRAEFEVELVSTLATTSVIGHPSWRMEPSHLAIRSSGDVRVRNRGGRAHTFTAVAQFGGGKIPVPALNRGLASAPECAGSSDIPPGGRARVSGLGPGNHRFQCCIHPWMRAVIEVHPE